MEAPVSRLDAVGPGASPLEQARDLFRAASGDVASIRACQMSLGGRLLALRRLGYFLEFGATDFPSLCAVMGLSTQEGRDLASIAEASEVRPELSAMVAGARISVQKAAVVAEVIRNPVLQRPGEDPLSLAAGTPARDLRNLVQRRKEESRLPEPPVSMTFFVSRRGADDFQHCRDLLSDAARRRLSEGEAFEGICDDFLERHDRERRARRALERGKVADGSGSVGAALGPPGRSSGERPPIGKPRTRFTPAAEKHALILRQGDRCAVEGCENRSFLQDAHAVPYRLGGSNGARNKHRLCPHHHGLWDRALMKIAGPPGRRVWVTTRGEFLGHLRGPPEGG
jgi:hypothetical protein